MVASSNFTHVMWSSILFFVCLDRICQYICSLLFLKVYVYVQPSISFFPHGILPQFIDFLYQTWSFRLSYLNYPPLSQPYLPLHRNALYHTASYGTIPQLYIRSVPYRVITLDIGHFRAATNTHARTQSHTHTYIFMIVYDYSPDSDSYRGSYFQ